MLIRQTLLYMPAQIIGPLAQFAAILVFTHWLAPEPYGVLTYILASQDFVFLLCLSWWSQYTVRYFSAHEAEGDGGYRGSEFTILVATLMPQILAAVLALLLISVHLSAALVGATILYTLTRCLSLHIGERARAQSLVLDYTLANSVGPVAGFALAFLAVALVAPTPEAALIGYSIAQVAALAWLMGRQSMELALRRPDPALLRRALGFGLPLIAAGVAAWFGLNAIRILVDHRLGTAAMGLIAVGWALGQRVTATAAMFVTIAAFPLAVEEFRVGSREAAFGQITTNGLLMLGITLPAAVGLWLVQDSLVSLLVATPFRATTIAVLPAALAAGVFRNIRTHIADQVFVLVERTQMVLLMTGLESGAVVVGCALGLLRGGPIGAAYGSAAGYGLVMVAHFIVARVVAGLRLPLVEAALVALSTCVMVAVVRLLPHGQETKAGAAAQLVVLVAVGATTYGAGILALFPSITRDVWSRWKRYALPRP